MKDSTKKKIIKEEEDLRTKKRDDAAIEKIKRQGILDHATLSETVSSKDLEHLIFPYDDDQLELPDELLQEIAKKPGIGRYSISFKVFAIWLMENLINPATELPHFIYASRMVGVSVTTIKKWWNDKERWLAYSEHFQNTAIRVIMQKYVSALLLSANAINHIDFERLAKSVDPKDQANLIKLSDSLFNRVLQSNQLLEVLTHGQETEEVEGIVAVAPDEHPEERPEGKKDVSKTD